MNFLLLGAPEDKHIEFARNTLQRSGHSVTCLSTEGLLEYFGLEFGRACNPPSLSRLRLSDSSFHAAWLRKLISPRTYISQYEDAGFQAAEMHSLYKSMLFAIECQIPTINKPSSVIQGDLKSLQLYKAQLAGLQIPRTLIASSLPIVRDFLKCNSSVIYKPLARSWLDCNGERLFLPATRLGLETLDLLEDGYCSGIFQAEVNKTKDVRLYVIGEIAIAYAVVGNSSELDWRSAFSSGGLKVCTPPEIVACSRSLLHSMDLDYGCLDFCINQQGDWIFLEVNTTGNFLGYGSDNPEEIGYLLCERLVHLAQVNIR